MADQEEGIPAPNPSPEQQQQQLQLDHTGQQQQVVHLNWSNFKQNFLGNLMKMQKHICSAQMTG